MKTKQRRPLHKGRVHKGRARHKLRIESRIFLNKSALVWEHCSTSQYYFKKPTCGGLQNAKNVLWDQYAKNTIFWPPLLMPSKVCAPCLSSEPTCRTVCQYCTIVSLANQRAAVGLAISGASALLFFNNDQKNWYLKNAHAWNFACSIWFQKQRIYTTFVFLSTFVRLWIIVIIHCVSMLRKIW